MYREFEKELTAWRFSAQRKPLIVKGARQVGKTHLLKTWGGASFPKVHYINFEKLPQAAKIFDRDLDVKRIIQEIGFLLKSSVNVDEDLLVLDEIQAAPKALTSLKYFCEDLPSLAVCSAGSLLGVILTEESFPVGKVSFLYLYPFSFREFLHAVDDRNSWEWLSNPSFEAKIPQVVHDHLWQMLRIYYAVGGMPEAVGIYKQNMHDMHAAFTAVRSIQRDLLSTYENDFAKHAGKLKSIHIQALYRGIPAQLSNAVDESVKRFKFGEIMPGKKGFATWERPLHWLINAGLVLQVKIANSAQLPIEHFCKANIFKLYMHDVGLLGCAQGLDPDTILNQSYGLAKGYFAENFVMQELRAAHPHQLWPLYGWSEGESEVEVIRAYRGAIIPIEVKAVHRSQAKSLSQFRKVYDPPITIKLSANPLHFDSSSRSLQLPLYLASWASLF